MQACFLGMERRRHTLPTRRCAAPDAFHPSERRLADAVRSFAGDVARATAAELAHLANVVSATVSRLVHKIGHGAVEDTRHPPRLAAGLGHRPDRSACVDLRPAVPFL